MYVNYALCLAAAIAGAMSSALPREDGAIIPKGPGAYVRHVRAENEANGRVDAGYTPQSWCRFPCSVNPGGQMCECEFFPPTQYCSTLGCFEVVPIVFSEFGKKSEVPVPANPEVVAA
ncbi:hypothetical protein QBC34DRAFT_426224 [Podospora aff. communis PSN243]|uniref:Long chronological lifespan protein 2 n=1 Tax=Podospora aff. communis PSN243 TaxID=3040156 RepID=A0AAV9GN48_9PEZI|nr:hypothetical protein QBC34DRAFT_426224 [Podospora aff. communis PSN243]